MGRVTIRQLIKGRFMGIALGSILSPRSGVVRMSGAPSVGGFKTACGRAAKSGAVPHFARGYRLCRYPLRSCGLQPTALIDIDRAGPFVQFDIRAPRVGDEGESDPGIVLGVGPIEPDAVGFELLDEG